jgi:hypothetical protein
MVSNTLNSGGTWVCASEPGQEGGRYCVTYNVDVGYNHWPVQQCVLRWLELGQSILGFRESF